MRLVASVIEVRYKHVLKVSIEYPTSISKTQFTDRKKPQSYLFIVLTSRLSCINVLLRALKRAVNEKALSLFNNKNIIFQKEIRRQFLDSCDKTNATISTGEQIKNLLQKKNHYRNCFLTRKFAKANLHQKCFSKVL